MRALVTGAASGIGRASCVRIAHDAAERGEKARIAAVDIAHGPALESLADELAPLGATIVPVVGDLSGTEDPAQVVGTACEAFGGLDALVSCAGINRPSDLLSYDVEQWDRTFAVNTRATWLLAKAAYPSLRENRGAIVAVGSVSGTQPHAGLAAYGPSKAALVMLVKVLAQELGPSGIRVNCVSPGTTKTGMTSRINADPAVVSAREERIPLRHIAEPEEIAAVITFLLSPAASYVTGHDLAVDGGFTGTLMGSLPGLSLITSS